MEVMSKGSGIVNTGGIAVKAEAGGETEGVVEKVVVEVAELWGWGRKTVGQKGKLKMAISGSLGTLHQIMGNRLILLQITWITPFQIARNLCLGREKWKWLWKIFMETLTMWRRV